MYYPFNILLVFFLRVLTIFFSFDIFSFFLCRKFCNDFFIFFFFSFIDRQILNRVLKTRRKRKDKKGDLHKEASLAFFFPNKIKEGNVTQIFSLGYFLLYPLRVAIDNDLNLPISMTLLVCVIISTFLFFFCTLDTSEKSFSIYFFSCQNNVYLRKCKGETKNKEEEKSCSKKRKKRENE